MRSRRRPPRGCWCCPTTATSCSQPRTPPPWPGGRPRWCRRCLRRPAWCWPGGSTPDRYALAENAGALAQLNGTLRCGEVAAAVRDAWMDGVAVTAGQYLALVEGRLQSSHDDAASAAAAVLRDLAQGMAELIVLTAPEAGLAAAIDALAGRRRAGRAQGRGRSEAYPLFACAAPGAVSLTAETTAVVLDSTADLADPGSRHANWSMVPLTVSFGDETFHDYVDIDSSEFYRRLQRGLPILLASNNTRGGQRAAQPMIRIPRSGGTAAFLAAWLVPWRPAFKIQAANSRLKFFVHYRDLIGRHIAKYGTHEPIPSRWIHDYLTGKPPGMFIDVGANLGWHAVHAAKHPVRRNRGGF